jgi:uncharacterized LabA/DUF88 family protein
VAERAVLFVDGNNWYHGLKRSGVRTPGRLDYAKISAKLVGPRTWIALRYYIGRVPQSVSKSSYAEQRQFISRLQRQDMRISAHFGRLEQRSSKNEAAEELLRYIQTRPPGTLAEEIVKELTALAHRHCQTRTLVEKAVDVMLAVDMVEMAQRDEYDCAYILTADGDFTPAVDAVVSRGRKVYAVSTDAGAQLRSVVKAFIRVSANWFTNCYV